MDPITSSVLTSSVVSRVLSCQHMYGKVPGVCASIMGHTCELFMHAIGCCASSTMSLPRVVTNNCPLFGALRGRLVLLSTYSYILGCLPCLLCPCPDMALSRLARVEAGQAYFTHEGYLAVFSCCVTLVWPLSFALWVHQIVCGGNEDDGHRKYSYVARQV